MEPPAASPSRGRLRIDFDHLTLDKKDNDNLRIYSDADENEELRVTLSGDLPLPIMRLIARGCEVALSGDKMAFTLPSELGQIGSKVHQLDLRHCSIVGTVPASLAQLTNLRRLELANNDSLGGAWSPRLSRARPLPSSNRRWSCIIRATQAHCPWAWERSSSMVAR